MSYRRFIIPASVGAAVLAGLLWWKLPPPSPSREPARVQPTTNPQPADRRAKDQPQTHQVSPSKIDRTPANTDEPSNESPQHPTDETIPPTPDIAFHRWTELFHSTPAGPGRDVLVGQGLELAERRRQWLFDLIETDPEAALSAMVSADLREDLPPEVAGLLEDRISGRGSFGVLVADDFEANQRDVRREVELNGERFDAFVYGSRASQTTTGSLPLWGVALGDPSGRSARRRIAVHPFLARRLTAAEVQTLAPGSSERLCNISGQAANGRGTEVLAESGGSIEAFCGMEHLNRFNERAAADGELRAADSWAQGPKTCLFMRVAFPDDPGEPITEDGAYALMDSVNQWFVENSYGTTSIIPAVTPLLRLPQTKAWYGIQGSGTLMNDARRAAREAGFDVDSFHWDILRHASVPGFGWSGLGYVRGKGTWLQSSSVGVACHELGHNYGVWHANYWAATGDSVIGPGSNQEYGNSFDTMGAASAGANQFNAYFKSHFDWLPDTAIHTITASGTYRLHAYDIATLAPGRTYALRVRKDQDRNYWAEFRQKFTSNRWLQNGILLNWDPWGNADANSASGTHLLDTTPGTAPGKDDAAVVIGRTFSDPSAGIHFTPVARSQGGGENWIDVSVQLGTFPSNIPPVLVLTADRVAASTGAVVHFVASAADSDGDTLAHAWDFGDGTFGPNAALASKFWTNTGDYVIRCTVSDMKGGTSSRQQLITVGSPSTFRASGRVLTGNGEPLDGARIHNGQSGAAYRVTWTDSDGWYVLPNLGAGDTNLVAIKYGFTLAPVGWTNPITPGTGTTTGLDWSATSLPVVNIVADDPNAAEAGTNTARFRITRTGPTNAPLSVRLNRTGTAGFTSDYTMSPAPSGTPLQITIAAGATLTNITIIPVSDTAGEGPESITITLLENAAYILAPKAEATAVIADDDPQTKPQVSVSTFGSGADNLATEAGGDAGVFAFTRFNGNTTEELEIHYAVSGSATPGLDYAALPGVVVIPAGETTVALALAAIDDLEVETNETITVTVLTNAAYTISSGSATIPIIDDDPVIVTITATDNTARESGASPATFTITRQGGLAANLLVQYALGGTASNVADFASLSGSMTIPAGRASATLTLTPVNDTLREGDEFVTLSLLGGATCNVGNPGSATIVIIDDEIPSVTVTTNDNTAAEAGLDAGSFFFSRTGPVTNALVVRYEITGTALPGADYEPLTGLIEIPAGATNATLPVVPVDDTFRESPERVTILLAHDPAYNIGTAAPQSVTINDDDIGAPPIGFALATSAVSEGGSFVQISVNLGTNSASTVTVPYAVTGGTATGGGADYWFTAGTLRFLPGTNQQSLSLSINNDSTIEPDETIVITLGNPTNAIPGSNFTHTLTILDDDQSGNITISAIEPLAQEAGSGPGRFRVARSGGTDAEQLVQLAVTGGASAPSDFAPIATTLVLPVGAGFADILISPVDDNTPETNEAVTIKLLNAPGGRISSPSSASVFIADNDSADALPVVTIETADAAAAEPGTDTAAFTIRRTGDTNAPLNISFTVGGTATSGTDFNSVGTSTNIPAGAHERTILITPRNDTTFEPDETVILTLTQTTAYRVGPAASARATISDDEVGVSIEAALDIAEDGSLNGGFVIRRSGSTASNLVVNLAVAGTASTDDFVALPATALLPAGSNSLFVPVIPVDDSLPEGDESIALTILGGTNYTPVAPASAAILLLDDEPSVSVTVPDAIAYEGGLDSGRFTITRSGSTNAPLTVHFQLQGSAANGADFTTIPASAVIPAVIPAGARSADVLVEPLDDALVEGAETVTLVLETNPAYVLFPPGSATVTVLDDEVNTRPAVAVLRPSADTVRLLNTSNALLLEASATDDARPNPPAVLTTSWRQISGPGEAGFTDSSSTNTSVRFTGDGTYLLRFTGDDGQLSSSAELTVIVGAAPAGNRAPLVDAGPAQSIPLGTNATLAGTVSDDALPSSPGAVTTRWIQLSGPGTVTFADSTEPATSAGFSEGGLYVLRLLADDGEVTTAGDVQITVIPPTVVSLRVINGNAAEFSTGGPSTGGQPGSTTPTGRFLISRTGDTGAELPVRLIIGGTAGNGIDYAPIPEIVIIPAGGASLNVTLAPVRDHLPEGAEFAEFTVAPSTDYDLSASVFGVINISDAPWDQWRREIFTASDATNALVVGELADPDHDGFPNLLEYAHNTHPLEPDTSTLFTGAFEPVQERTLEFTGFVVRFPQRLSPTDLIYEVEVSRDFLNWFSGTSVAAELFPRLGSEDGTTFITRVQVFEYTTPEGSPPKFVRLKVRLAEPIFNGEF